MAEVGRAAVRDPGARLPGGFWAAVAVWLERPQVANKRLCGVRLESRRSASLPRIEACDQEERAEAGCGLEEGPGPGPRSPDGDPGTRPNADLKESQDWRQQGEAKREAAAASLLPGSPGQPGEAVVGEGDFPAWDLDSLWDDFSRSLVGGNHDMLAFLTGSEAGSQPEAQHDLEVVLRTVIPKRSPRCLLSAPRREMVVRGKIISDSKRCQR